MPSKSGEDREGSTHTTAHSTHESTSFFLLKKYLSVKGEVRIEQLRRGYSTQYVALSWRDAHYCSAQKLCIHCYPWYVWPVCVCIR